MNLIGQLRLYSAVDLLVLLSAARATPLQVAVSFSLWFGFLLYLESCHKHTYRQTFPKLLWLILWVIGVVAPPVFESWRIGVLTLPRPEGAVFILFSWMYAKKTQSHYGLWAPGFRGVQSLVLVGGIQGYAGILPWLALVLTAIRNILGDVRDVAEDKIEGMRTIPIVLGWRSVPHIHLIGVLATSLVWFSFAHLFTGWLFLLWALEIITYYWTPRHAAQS